MDELANLWSDAEDRSDITRASSIVDGHLKHRPYEQSWVLEDGSRAMTVGPLMLQYRVSDDDCIVTVLYVWRSDATSK